MYVVPSAYNVVIRHHFEFNLHERYVESMIWKIKPKKAKILPWKSEHNSKHFYVTTKHQHK